MIQETLEVFETMLEKEPRLLLDAYVPKDGTYRLVELTEDGYRIKRTIDIHYDKKTGIVEGSANADYWQVKTLDYYSKLLEMNKPIDPSKIIHSNNYLSFAAKKDSVKEGKLTAEILDGYYHILKNPREKYKRPKAKALYESVLEEIGEPDQEILERISSYIRMPDIWEGIDWGKKEYLKLFFVFPDEERTGKYYEKEYLRYLIPNIYNNNDFNEREDGVIVGLPNDNMGMNAKKPYLGSLTRKVSVPCLVRKERAISQAKLFDYLLGMAAKGQVNVYVDFENQTICGYSNREAPQELETGYYLRLRKGKEVEIIYGSAVVNYNPFLNAPFCLRNSIGIQESTLEKFELSYNIYYENLWEIRHAVDQTFFEGRLTNNLYTEAKDIPAGDGNLKRMILETRDRFILWFYLNRWDVAEGLFDKALLEVIFNSIRSGRMLLAQRQFNLKWSLQDYLHGQDRRMELRMEDIKKCLRNHINSKEDWMFSSEEEYGFAVGQIVSYLSSRSKANNRPASFVNPFLDAKDHADVRQKLLRLYKKYNYAIPHLAPGRGEQLFSHIMTYRPDEKSKLDREMIAAGFASTSLIYEKKNQGDNQESEGTVNE